MHYNKTVEDIYGRVNELLKIYFYFLFIENHIQLNNFVVDCIV